MLYVLSARSGVRKALPCALALSLCRSDALSARNPTTAGRQPAPPPWWQQSVPTSLREGWWHGAWCTALAQSQKPYVIDGAPATTMAPPTNGCGRTAAVDTYRPHDALTHWWEEAHLRTCWRGSVYCTRRVETPRRCATSSTQDADSVHAARVSSAQRGRRAAACALAHSCRPPFGVRPAFARGEAHHSLCRCVNTPEKPSGSVPPRGGTPVALWTGCCAGFDTTAPSER